MFMMILVYFAAGVATVRSSLLSLKLLLKDLKASPL